ncbi:MAG TPA: FAD-binding oxidoreductase [Anaerolineae bacterium]|nr:FAD-binding oxidoreductase [Anaerolineae bacterium]
MNRNEFRSEMIRSELEDIVGQHFVSVDDSDKLVYSTDWSWMPQMWLDRGQPLPTPDYIVHPDSAEQIAEIMDIANKYRIPVVPWGGGSGTQGGALPLFGGILLDTKRMDKIIEIDEVSLKVTAQAGINGEQLEWALHEKGLMLPHYAAASRCATLGGYLAPRGTGTISTKYGKAEDMVLNMQIVLPTGEIIRTAPVPQHAAGPDWPRLFLGAEGTFGVITEATMRLDYLPEARLMRAVLFTDLSKALEAGRLIMTRRLHPFVIRLYDPESTRSQVKKVLGLDYEGAYMVMGFDGDPDIAALEEQKALAICTGLGGQDVGRAPGEAWWEHRYDFYYPPLSLHLPWMYGTTETVTTYDKIEPLYWAVKRAVEEGFPEWDIKFIAHFSHWFHWGVMCYSRFIIEEPPADAQEALQLHNRVWQAAMQAVIDNGGMINEHHGIGLKLGRYMRQQYGDAWPFMLRLKKMIDPNGIMNPGKVGFGF